MRVMPEMVSERPLEAPLARGHHSFEDELLNARVARKLYDLRTHAGLTQKELAERVATTASVISRLEDADYEGHSLSMLRRIADALDQKVEIRFVQKP